MNPQSTENPLTQIGTLTTTLTTLFQQNYLLSTLSLTELNKCFPTPEFLTKEMDHLHKVLQDNHYPTQFFQQGKQQQKANKKPNPSTVKFIKGARVVIPYIKGLSEQYRHILAKYRVRVLFKGTSTIKSLLMHPKDPIPDAQNTDTLYHWKCPADNCTAEHIGP